MYKDRLINEIQSLQQKIARDNSRGFDTSNKQKALGKLLAKAKQKGIKLYKYT